MGLPFVVLNMVSVLMFKGLGVGDAQIALWTSLIMLPWTLKFLWSPFLEMFKTKKFFVVLTQLVTGAGFALVAFALNLPFFFCSFHFFAGGYRFQRRYARCGYGRRVHVRAE